MTRDELGRWPLLGEPGYGSRASQPAIFCEDFRSCVKARNLFLRPTILDVRKALARLARSVLPEP